MDYNIISQNIILNPIVLIFTLIIIYIFLFFSFGIRNSTNENSSSSFLGIFTNILFYIILFLILYKLIEYIYGINIYTSIQNYYTTNPELDIDIHLPVIEKDEEKEIHFLSKPEVFNIPENIYGYEDAKAVCSAFNSSLASYEQIEDYYNNKGEFCNYGWSEGQMVLFPTQKQTFDKLQKIKGHENDCGRQGVNGGFISNPLVKFGANCYGYKPKMTSEEQEIMENVPDYPLTKKDLAFEKRVDYWKNRLDEIIVSPFNKNQWY